MILPSDLQLIAKAIRTSGQPRDRVKPIAQAIANAIELSQGRKFDYHKFMALALGPVEPLSPTKLAQAPIRDSNGITHVPPANAKSRLWRAYDTPEQMGF